MADQEQRNQFWENRSLFSDYFLSERLDQKKEWKEDIQKIYEFTAELYQDVKDRLPKFNEAQTEEHFIKPILTEILGFSFDVQHSVKQKGRINRPDYTLFADKEILKKAQENRDDDNRFLANAIAVADAKYWERSLDGRGDPNKDPELSNANPSFQIVNYLTATGKDWGILTNGRHWRLYYAKARSRVDSYFEVDLKKILENGNAEAFRYFYHFFRSSAFQIDPSTGKSFTEAVYEGSIDYGVQIEKKLKDLIFDKIFLKLSRGFVEYRKNELGIEEETENSLADIYQGTLRLLYRLLFLLHAESRGLLPVNDEKGYYQRSFQKLKRDFAETIDNEIVLSEVSDDVWNDLAALFRIIDKGDKRLNVPRYNGGLFRNDHPGNQFLNEHKIADYYLVPALELLTRETDPVSGQKRFIDYKSLNVEQLGSIYEGLLEFHLRIAKEPMAVVREKGREIYKPREKVNNPSEVLEKGELYLENDKGERKATGSYYTPHYIVEYIVEHALGPVFEERATTFRDLMEQLEPKYRKFEELDEKIKGGDTSTKSHNQRKALNLEKKTLERKATESLLSIKICDPAMGSGHFLKEATDKLAEKMITLLAEFPRNPVNQLLEEIRSQILESLQQQDISIDAKEHLKDTNLIKRMVMKRSIYGVDLNPMAVELAKLSLWLDSFTVGAPLSFLDHHLRTGNSLIGTTVNEVKFTLEIDEDSQIDIFGGPFAGLLTATELMRNVALKTDATIGEIEESIDQFSEYEKAVLPYKKLLDLWLSKHFDNDKAIMLLRQYPEKVIAKYKGQKSDLKKQYEPILEEAEKITNEKEFFHWELEFPEVFVDLKRTKWLDNPGFDVVVGNPPYGYRMIPSNLEKKYYSSFYKSHQYDYEFYIYFTERSSYLIKRDGIHSFIIPNTYLTASSMENFRRFLLENCTIKEIFYLGLGIFEGVTLESVIQTFSKSKTDEPITIKRLKEKSNSINHKAVEEYQIEREKFGNNEGNLFKIFLSSSKRKITEALQEVSISLENLCYVTVGINTGYIRDVLVSDQKENDRFHRMVSGRNIGRYHIEWDDEWIIYDHELVNSYGDKGRTLPPENIFTEPKLLFQRTRRGLERKLIGTLDREKFYNLNRVSNVVLNEDVEYQLEFLAAILNSTLLDKYFNWAFNEYEVKPVHLKKLPIRKIDFSQFNPEKSKEYPDQLKELFQSFLTDSSSNKLLELVNQLINDEEEYRLPLIHDLLAYLAEKMLEYNKEKQRLNSALDPFKFLNKGTAFKSFKTVFAESIKYGQLLNDEIDLGKAHHDIEGLKLEPVNPSDRSKRSDGSEWLLYLNLKHRDPATDWSDWQKDEDDNIVRSTNKVYQFDLSYEQGRYWQQSFEVLDQFKNSSNFPGGKTRTTHEKLMESDVPVFDEKANIEPLIELREELAETEEKIEKTDWLIDQVVYRLYGLTEEEIQIIESA